MDVTRPDPAQWDEPRMRQALGRCDLGSVFRALKTLGYDQGQIAELTGLTQPNISAVVNGHRKIRSPGVLGRIADGLGIPADYLGLRRCPFCQHWSVAPPLPLSAGPVVRPAGPATPNPWFAGPEADRLVASSFDLAVVLAGEDPGRVPMILEVLAFALRWPEELQRLRAAWPREMHLWAEWSACETTPTFRQLHALLADFDARQC